VPITHTNAKGQIFSLHQGTTKTGKPKYYFAMQSEGTLAESIPAGYEIYENPNAQVFLRRIPPKIITDAERHVVEEGMRTYAQVKDYKIDVRGNAILIHTAIQEIDALADLFKDLYPDPTANVELMANLRKAVGCDRHPAYDCYITGAYCHAKRYRCRDWLNRLLDVKVG